MRYRFPLAVAGLALVAALTVVLFGLSQPQSSEANHNQAAGYPQIDYVALDAFVSGNSKNALDVTEPPWDACVETTAPGSVDIDIVVDKIPTVPNTDGPSAGSLFGVTGMQFLVEYDNTKLTRGNIDPSQSLLNNNVGSLVAPTEVQQAAGPPRVDFLSLVDINTFSTDSREDNIQGVGMRISFTVDAAATGFAEVSLLESFSAFQTKVTAGTGVEQENLTIANFSGGPNNDDANDLQTIQIAILPETCAGAPEPDDDDDGVPNIDDDCADTADQADVDANGCSDAQVDGDGDGICDPNAPSGGTSNCTGSDNCPSVDNFDQANDDGDALGDACDTEEGVEGIGDCGDGKDNDGDTLVDGDDSGCLSDSDGDGTPDINDSEIGVEGVGDCDDGFDNDGDGFTDGDDSGCLTDTDGDGIADVNDTETGVEGVGDCGDGKDNDGDGKTDAADDGCLTDTDGDGIADVDDDDDDGDGVLDGDDNCPLIANGVNEADIPGVGNQLDSDNDDVGDACDTESGVAGVGDCGDGKDNDGDGKTDGADSGCLPDADGDGIADASDNCPNVKNADQADADGDGTGNACDTETGVAGVADCGDGKDNDGDGKTDGADSACLPDADGDGVADASDKCPGTPAGDPVNADGCSTAQLAAVRGPGPTELPDGGGAPGPGSSGINMLVMLLAGSALLMPAGAILWAQRRRQARP